MTIEPTRDPARDPAPGERGDGQPLPRRLGWFVGIWAASIAVLGIVATAIRAVLL